MPSRYTEPVIDRLISLLAEIRDQAVALARLHAGEVTRAHPDLRISAANLIHYLALRNHDIRGLQRELAALGLSSLGRTEAHALDGIDAVLAALHRIAGRPMTRTPDEEPPVDLRGGAALLRRHTEQLLGPRPSSRFVRIMVTMPTAAATDCNLVRDLIRAGMGVCRINSAHDDPQTWEAMIRHVREAARELERPCRILMDLAGPKLRTGPIEQLYHVSKCRPRKNIRGIVTQPGRVWLTPSAAPSSPQFAVDVTWPVDRSLLAAAEAGDDVELSDCRGKRRLLHVVATGPQGCVAETVKTIYVESGTTLALRRGGRVKREGRIGKLPPVEEFIQLRKHDTLLLTGPGTLGRPAVLGGDGSVISPPRVSCTLPDVLTDVGVGHRVFFDDGKIGGVVLRAEPEELLVEITHTPAGGTKLRADKGINFPDSSLRLPSLTDKDLVDLDFAAGKADLVGLSFVRSADDVHRLRVELSKRGGGHLGILLKIETKQAFDRLPQLLLAGLQSSPIGVMVARGDLGVEVGFERLAEVQEEILWLCEAAHIPVIWATQVLETLARTGMPSRAEVTDAAMSMQAECVMLNKGPYIVEAVSFLRNILRRMENHRHKKRSLLRRLSVSRLDSQESPNKH